MNKKLMMLIGVEVLAGILIVALGYFLYTTYLNKYMFVAPKLQELEEATVVGDIQTSESYLYARDLKRKRDLDKLHAAIELYHLKEKKLPDKLTDLAPIYIEEIPLDPTTLEPYDQYELNLSKTGYSVCTNFLEANSEEDIPICYHSPEFFLAN